MGVNGGEGRGDEDEYIRGEKRNGETKLGKEVGNGMGVNGGEGMGDEDK